MNGSIAPHVHPRDKKVRPRNKTSKTALLHSPAYFTKGELQQFEVLLHKRKEDAIETAKQENDFICEEREQRNFGLHRDNGSEEMSRTVAFTILQQTGKYGEQLLKAWKRIEFSLHLHQNVMEKKGKHSEIDIKPISVEELIRYAKQDYRLSEQLKNIGIFGLCKQCNMVIDKNRMNAVPHTTLCCACKSKLGSKKIS